MTGRHRKLSHAGTVLLCVLALALAAALAVQLDHRYEPGPKPKQANSLVHSDLADVLRAELDTFHPGTTNQQVVDTATSLCAALKRRPLVEVYATHDLPVSSPADATQFFTMSVLWGCPEHAPALGHLLGE